MKCYRQCLLWSVIDEVVIDNVYFYLMKCYRQCLLDEVLYVYRSVNVYLMKCYRQCLWSDECLYEVL